MFSYLKDNQFFMDDQKCIFLIYESLPLLLDKLRKNSFITLFNFPILYSQTFF